MHSRWILNCYLPPIAVSVVMSAGLIQWVPFSVVSCYCETRRLSGLCTRSMTTAQTDFFIPRRLRAFFRYFISRNIHLASSAVRSGHGVERLSSSHDRHPIFLVVWLMCSFLVMWVRKSLGAMSHGTDKVLSILSWPNGVHGALTMYTSSFSSSCRLGRAFKWTTTMCIESPKLKSWRLKWLKTYVVHHKHYSNPRLLQYVAAEMNHPCTGQTCDRPRQEEVHSNIHQNKDP